MDLHKRNGRGSKGLVKKGLSQAQARLARNASISPERVAQILRAARRRPILVVGDVMLDHFIWGAVRRISPEAPVPVVEFERESLMPGGAANVARNLTSLRVPAELCGFAGQDDAGRKLRKLLLAQDVGCDGIVGELKRPTSIKTRIIAGQQQVVRLDNERTDTLSRATQARLLSYIQQQIHSVSALIVGDYGKGAISQELLDSLRSVCREHDVWLSLDPKPVHKLQLSGLSLITPNRKEAFELAGIVDTHRAANPLEDRNLLNVAEHLLGTIAPSVLLITLGDHGMLLCQNGLPPIHIPTVAQEVFDVSGAGDTVIATFTLAIVNGATPLEAAVISNFAAGVVVGKLGTATLSEEELIASVQRHHSALPSTLEIGI